MNRTLRTTTLALLLGLVGVVAMAKEPSEQLDGSGFTVRAAQNQVTAQHARGEMWLTEGDEGFSVQREYTFAVLVKSAAQQGSQVRPALAPRLGERLER